MPARVAPPARRARRRGAGAPAADGLGRAPQSPLPATTSCWARRSRSSASASSWCSRLQRGVAAAAPLLVHDLRQAGHVRGRRAAAGRRRRRGCRSGSGRLSPGRCCSSASRARCSCSSPGTARQREPELGRHRRASRCSRPRRSSSPSSSGAPHVLSASARCSTRRPRCRAGAAGRRCSAGARPRRPRPRDRAGPHGPRRCAHVHRGRAAAALRRGAVSGARGLRPGREQRRTGWTGSRTGAGRRATRRGTGWQPCTRSGRWPPAAGGASAWGRAGRSGRGCPRPTTTSSSRSSARSSGSSARSPCSRCSRCSPYGLPGRARRRRRFVQIATAASSPGSLGQAAGQHRRGGGAAAGHRRPAPAGLERRLGADDHAHRARDGPVFRPARPRRRGGAGLTRRQWSPGRSPCCPARNQRGGTARRRNRGNG